MFLTALLHINQSSPLLPGEKHMKTRDTFCNWQRGKRQREKGCVANTCFRCHRGSLPFISQNLKNKVKSELMPPLLAFILPHFKVLRYKRRVLTLLQGIQLLCEASLLWFCPRYILLVPCHSTKKNEDSTDQTSKSRNRSSVFLDSRIRRRAPSHRKRQSPI